MASYAKTTIVGNLGNDPEVRYMANGEAACNFNVAVTESWKDKTTGEKKEETTWYRVSAFSKLADICGQYLRKGSSVLIDGKIKTRKYEAKDGTTREAWELRANEMRMLGGRPEGQPAESRTPPPRPAETKPSHTPPAGSKPPLPAGSWEDMDDDIPF